MPTVLGDARRVGPYEILESLGQGAMGEVYLARDSRLSRNVAIKVIADSGDDPVRARRFIQEARSASALNHPNIVTIHEFGSHDGISYIVSELVQGESLRSLLKRGPLPVPKLVEIGIQIADALQAAHEAGIVHRDLKPENIMITPGGRVKLLDFGLAKPLLRDPERPGDDNLTEPGLIVGTVAYMSPEQARGEAASIQSDQFAFGLILHEMATGNHPYKRETPMETLLAIASVQRPPFTPGPVALRMLVERCLSPESRRRFESSEEIAERLRKIARDLSEDPVVPAEARPSKKLPVRALGSLAALIAVICAAVFLTLRSAASSGWGDPLAYDFIPFSSESRFAAEAAWSPNGRIVAFAAEGDGVMQIFTKAEQSASATQVTACASDCTSPFWDPNGQRIYFVSDSSLWAIYSTGGTPELVDQDVRLAAVSPDGRHFAKLRTGGLYLDSARLDVPESISAVHFSPDGKRLAAATGQGLYSFNLASGAREAHFREYQRLDGFSWMPDSRQVVISCRGRLWAGDTQRGSIRPLTNGVTLARNPAVSRDGRTAVFAAVDSGSRLARIDLASGRPDADALSGDDARWPAWAPSRTEYAYVAREKEGRAIRLRSVTSDWERTLATGEDFRELTFSPSGLSIAYVAADRIWILPLNGEPAVRLSREESPQRLPAWSPDGNWIAYFGQRGLARARVDGSEPPAVVAGAQGTALAWSPDGEWLAYAGAEPGVALVLKDGSKQRRVGTGTWIALAWPRDLHGVRQRGRQLTITTLDTASGRETNLSHIGSASALHGFSMTPDGQTAALAVDRASSRLWLIKGLTSGAR